MKTEILDAFYEPPRYLWIVDGMRCSLETRLGEGMRTSRSIGPPRVSQQDSGNHQELTDDELVASAQRDTTRFDDLYERYEHQIFAFIRTRVGGNREHVEDLTSGVFTKALAGLPTFRAGSFRGWLYRIARNVVIDDLRTQRSTTPIDDMTALPDRAESVDNQVVQRMLQLALRESLDVLPSPQRSIIELRLQGLTAPQIGARLGMNHEAVKSAQYRAFERLLSHFQRTGQIRREDL